MVKKIWNTLGWPSRLSLGLLLFFMVGAFWPDTTDRTSEDWVRERSVMLFSAQGQCSGEQVRAPSGRDYILSAGHCHGLADKNENIWVKTEAGNILERRVVAEDPLSDLLLIEGVPGLEGLPMADSIRRLEHVKTFTHGKGMMTYKTDGLLIQVLEIKIPIWEGLDKDKIPTQCFMPKIEIVQGDDFFFGEVYICYLDVMEVVTTAKIVPGSSGGMIVNDQGQLIGIASATDQYGFGYLVRLSDIRRFVGAY